LELAKRAWLAREAGKPIPPPRYRPVIYQTPRSPARLRGKRFPSQQMALNYLAEHVLGLPGSY
jgi:hypothetical protein